MYIELPILHLNPLGLLLLQMSGQPVNGISDDGDTLDTQKHAMTDVDFLIVGAGPAGASLACFLASHGSSQSCHSNGIFRN